jgi:hypothetical protein
LCRHGHSSVMSVASTNAEATFVVLRCTDLDRAEAFYRALGLSFESQKHGSGPEHDAANLGGVVVELYPKQIVTPRGCVWDFALVAHRRRWKSPSSRGRGSLSLRIGEPRAVLRDPDGHTLDIGLTA